MRYENKTLLGDKLPFLLKDDIFSNCVISGPMPDTDKCEFHDCDLRGCEFRQLTNCKFFSCNLDGCNFEKADISFSVATDCSAIGCRWAGVRTVLDCRWWSGLVAREEDAALFLAMAIIPNTPLKHKLLNYIPTRFKKSIVSILRKEFRRV